MRSDIWGEKVVVRKLHFAYEMEIEYSIPASRCHFTIKCVPKDTNRQKISDYKIGIKPDTSLSYGRDGLGNVQIYGVNTDAHDSFVFSISGNALTGLADYETDADEQTDIIFAHPHGLNVAGDRIVEFYNANKPDQSMSVLEQIYELMHALHRAFAYEPYTTDVNTSAEEAMAQGYGVCQDFAHIFIAFMHLLGLPARYVTGLIVGEGASHAWVEVLVDGKWYGVDPTNDSAVGDEHIRIGIGRDARDCTINRGIMRGGGLHIQTIRVNVDEEQ